MKKHFIDLLDGTRLPIRVNFATIYYLQDCKRYYQIVAKTTGKKKKPLSQADAFEMSAYLIYAMLRSNGKDVTFDEALALVPPDPDSIRNALTAFQEEYAKYSKKKPNPIPPKH